ncbi:MAG: DNA primase [Minicystis sp.]
MISPETIALVKERTDLVALIAETVKLTRRGRSFVGLCPFHQEKTPSFHVNAERGFFHCFGCKESGGAVDFLMKTEGHSFPEAIRVLAERAGIEVTETATDQERREANAARKAKDDLYAVNGAAATYFERCLRGNAAHPLAKYAREELARRGLPLPDGYDKVGEDARIGDTLQAFRVGYAPFGWDGLANYLKQQGISPVQAERVGLLVPRSSGSGHYDRFRHRLMFAVIDVMGRVIAFSGRALPDPTPEELSALRISGPSTAPDAAPAKYINSPESPIYTKGEHLFGLLQARQAIRQAGEAIVVEGNFDVVSLHARGINTAVAPLGTAFTAAQAKLLKRFAPSVIVLFDGDNAGRKATRAARMPCREGGLDAKVASLPKGMDPDDFVRKHGREGLERLLKNARGMREHLIEDALDGEAFRSGSLEEQRARIRAVTQLLSEEADPTLRAMAKTYADQLSSKLVMRGQPLASLRELEVAVEQALSTGLRAAAPLPASQAPVPHDRARSRSRPEEISLEMLGALLDFPELLDDPEVENALTSLDGEAALAVAALRRAVARHVAHAKNGPTGESTDEDPTASTGPGRRSGGVEIGVYADEFLAQIPRSIHSFAVGRLASPAFDTADVARGVLLDNARKLSSLTLKRENAAEIEQLHRVEAQGDADMENELLRAMALRAKKRHGLS